MEEDWGYVKILHGHELSVWALSASPDNKFIVSGSNDQTLRVWRVGGEWECIKVLRGHREWVQSVAISADGRWIISGSEEGSVGVWRVGGEWECVRLLPSHERGVLGVAITPDGKYIISGSYDYTLHVWRSDGGEMAGEWKDEKVLRGHMDRVRCVCASADERYIVSGSDDKTVRVWSIEGAVNWRPSRHLSFGPHYRRVLWALVLGLCRLRSTSAQRENSDAVRGVYWCFTSTDSIKIGESDGVSVCADENGSEHKHSSIPLQLLRNWDPALLEFTLEQLTTDWECVMTLKGHDALVWAVATSPDCHFIFSGSTDNTVRVWRVGGDWPCVGVLQGHGDWIRALVVSSDGRYIVSGSDDRTVRVWELLQP